jgi:hypothetical protein
MLRVRIRMFSRFLEPKSLNGPMNVVDTVRTAKELGLTLVPYADYSDTLRVQGNSYTKVRTGTLVIHEADGRMLGSTVISGGSFYSPETFVYEVPGQYVGKQGWLIAESPDFDFVDKGRNRYEVVVPEKKVIHVERAATHAGRFRRDHDTGIPVGDRLRDVDGKKLGTVSVNNKHESCIDLIAKDVNGNIIYLDVPTSDPLKALARQTITPQNYVEMVVAAVSAGIDGRMEKFVADWAKDDPSLANGLVGCAMR